MERVVTWNNIGTEVIGCTDMESVLAKSKLDYTVIKKPVFLPTVSTELDENGNYPVEFNKIENRFATVRKEDGHVYDIVSDRYEIVQNHTAFSFVDYMTEDIEFVKAGETETGKVYIIARMEEMNILGDKFTPYIIFRNGFTGAVRISSAICPLRIVCQNQFNFAFKETANTVAIRHMGNAHERLEDAKESLRMCADYMSHLNIVAEKYAGMKFDKFKLNAILNEMFPINEEGISEHKRTLLKEEKLRFITAYEQDDNTNFRGTAWGIINAYTDLITHKEPRSKKSARFENQFIRSIDNNMNYVLDIVHRFESVAM